MTLRVDVLASYHFNGQCNARKVLIPAIILSAADGSGELRKTTGVLHVRRGHRTAIPRFANSCVHQKHEMSSYYMNGYSSKVRRLRAGTEFGLAGCGPWVTQWPTTQPAWLQPSVNM